MAIIILFILLLLFNIIPAFAEQNNCEGLAKNYQRVHGGDLIFIQPLKSDGTYDFGEYNGHWFNKAYSKERGTFYYDPLTDNYYKSMDEGRIWWERAWAQKAVVYDINQRGAPFAIVWHY